MRVEVEAVGGHVEGGGCRWSLPGVSGGLTVFSNQWNWDGEEVGDDKPSLLILSPSVCDDERAQLPSLL
jgi:hypothetical protein